MKMVDISGFCSVSIFFTIFNFITATKADGIGCFSCKSINHDNPACEDKFNNTAGYYKQNCWASRTGRIGKFPGTQCIKMIAEDEDSGYSMLVRDCVVDNGGTNAETEIGRMGHCGWMRVIKFNDRRMRGCLVTCDTDGCNGTESMYSVSMLTLLFLLGVYYQT